MISAPANPVAYWARSSKVMISKRFHNHLLIESSKWPELRWLLSLFASPAPVGNGKYNHHDGLRPPNRRTT